MEDREVIKEIILNLKEEGQKINLATVIRYIMDIYLCNLGEAWTILKPNKDLI